MALFWLTIFFSKLTVAKPIQNGMTVTWTGQNYIAFMNFCHLEHNESVKIYIYVLRSTIFVSELKKH